MAEENGTHLFTFGWLFSGFSFFQLRNRAMTSSLKTLKFDKQQLYMRNIQISKQTSHDSTCKKDSSRTHFARAHVRTCGKIQIRKTIDLTQRLLAIKEES